MERRIQCMQMRHIQDVDGEDGQHAETSAVNMEQILLHAAGSCLLNTIRSVHIYVK